MYEFQRNLMGNWILPVQIEFDHNTPWVFEEPYQRRKVLVCGSRKKDYVHEIDSVLRAIEPTLVIHGDATGVDSRANQWCLENGIHSAAVPALWHRYGNSAGPMRNKAMLALKPEVVVALPGGTGTENMTCLARAYSVPILKVPAHREPRSVD